MRWSSIRGSWGVSIDPTIIQVVPLLSLLVMLITSPSIADFISVISLFGLSILTFCRLWLRTMPMVTQMRRNANSIFLCFVNNRNETNNEVNANTNNSVKLILNIVPAKKPPNANTNAFNAGNLDNLKFELPNLFYTPKLSSFK